MINLPRTFYRLFKYIIGNNFDLLIGADACMIGKILNIPWLYFTDDDIHTTPHQILNFIFADYVVAPKLCDIGRFNYKKISYDGHKAIAHLHPRYFKPKFNALPKQLIGNKPYFLIRLSKYNSIHDTDSVSGISDDVLKLIIYQFIN